MKIKWVTTSVILLCSIMATSVYAQSPSIKFDRLSSDQGLSQAGVTSIIQDARGFIWIGTKNGLNRYDGYSFTIYKNAPGDSTSLSDNAITCLFIDKGGKLWVGTDGGGINVYNDEFDNFTSFKNRSDPNSLSYNTVTNIFQDKQDHFWVSTSGGGLNKWDTKNNRFYRFFEDRSNPEALQNNYIKQVYEDSSGQLWLAYDAGVAKINDQGKNKVSFTTLSPNSKTNSIPSKYGKGLYESDGKLWVVSDGGLSLMNKAENTFRNYTYKANNANSLANKYAKCLTEDAHNNLWIGTDGGVSIFNPKTESFINLSHETGNENSLNNNYVKAIYRDNTGTIWIGTDGGVNIYDERKEQFGYYHYQSGQNNSLSSDNVFSVYLDDKNFLWVGTDIGLNKIDRMSGNIQKFKHNTKVKNSLSNNYVKAIFKDSKNNFWIGTDQGLNKAIFNKKEEVIGFKSYSINEGLSIEAVVTLEEDNDGRLWIGTWGGGINIMDTEKETFEIFLDREPYTGRGLQSSQVWKLLKDSKGRMWAATRGGLSLYDKPSNSFTTYRHDSNNPKTLSNNRVLSLYESANGTLWVGTNGGGLNSFDLETQEFKSYNHIQELSGNVLHGISGDNSNNIWISSNKGLLNFSIKNNEVTRYDINDGLQGNEFNTSSLFKSISGELFFGGVNGLNYFHPEKLTKNQNKPPVYITSFSLSNKKILPHESNILSKSILTTKEITLSYDDKLISFDFVGISYRNASKNLYAYKMDNFDEDWTYVPSNRRFATYTYLEPGKYTFQVKASNNDGVWNDEGISLALNITPPFWQEWWFRILSIIAIIGAAVGFYKWRTRTIKRQKRELERIVKERTQEIREKNQELEVKNKNITDSIRYGKNIQHALLPKEEAIKDEFEDIFIIYKAKDIVSGDFYWFTKVKEKTIIAVVDCTGHGVPGAFMSMIGETLLNTIVNVENIYTPSLILENLHRRIREELNQEDGMNDDGMDMALCTIEPEMGGYKKVTFAGAKNSIYYLNKEDKSLLRLKGTNKSIGGITRNHSNNSKGSFENKELKCNPGDMIYLASDGIVDQSSPSRKRYGSGRLKKILESNAPFQLEKQKELLLEDLSVHQQDTAQRDDITIIGIKL